jgi:hypothetical protein
MTPDTLWLVIFLLPAVAALAGIFLYGWKRRKEKMPDVPPLTAKDDEEWK